MRPRPDAAENPLAGNQRSMAIKASMRPRPDAAENLQAAGGKAEEAACFNEAAARCRGKRDRRRQDGFQTPLLQ